MDKVNNLEVYDDTDKKAYPELLLKVNILNAEADMLRAEKIIRENNLYNNVYDLNIFSSNIIVLWSYIKMMVLDKELHKDAESYVQGYIIINKLEKGAVLSFDKLLFAKNYLLYCLHQLNITNLLIKGVDWKTEVFSEL